MTRWWPLAAAVAVAGLAGAVLVETRGLTDLAVYAYGGRGVLDGRAFYDAGDPVTGLPFTYPPFAALLMVPVALIPAWLAGAVWTAGSVAGLAVVMLLVARAAGRDLRPWQVAGLATVAVAAEPVWQSLSFGQVNLLLMAALVVDLLRPERRWSGVLVGLAAAVKLTPLVFVVLLVLVGRPSAAVRAVATFAATIALGFLLLPGQATTYWTGAVSDPGRVGGPAYAANQCVYGVLARVLDGPPPTLLWLAVAGPVALGVLLVGAAWWRRGDRALGTCLAAVAMLLASPISWSHHWVWAVPLAILLAVRCWPAAVAWSGLFVAAPIWWPPHGDDAEHTWGPVEHLVGGSYVVAALVLVGWAAWRLRPLPTMRRWDPTEPPPAAAGAPSARA